ncbi:MAG: hypothetical protein K2K91_07290 [Ruminococcus sp.]|nr:hypothetical protein [Ruminococcus sp.]
MKKYISFIITVILCLVFSSCDENMNVNNSKEVEKDIYVESPEKFVDEYIMEKYGFCPEIKTAQRVTSNQGLFPVKRDTAYVLVKCSDGEHEFDVLANTYSAENISCSDNYQKEQIKNDFKDWFSSELPNLKEISIIGTGNTYYSNFYTEYYDGENLFDFMNGFGFDIYAFYVNHDFSDESQFSFLEKMDKADICYGCMFISCYSDEDVEKIKNETFPNEYEAVHYAPYIEEYSYIFRNSATERKPEYHKLNIHEGDGFLYSVMDDVCLYCHENSDKYLLDTKQSFSYDSFDSEHKLVSPVWNVSRTGRFQNLCIYIPVDKIDYNYEPTLIYSGSYPHTYELIGEYTDPRMPESSFIKNSSYISIIGDYAVFDINSYDTIIDDTSFKMGIFKD